MAQISSHRDLLDSIEPGREPQPAPTSARAGMALEYVWERRIFLFRHARLAFLLAVAIMLLVPNTYESTTRLMPPGQDKTSQLAFLSSLAQGSNPLLGAAADMLGQKSTGALFVGVLQSDLLQNRIVDRYNLRQVYGVRYEKDARQRLASHASILEDRKSGIIRISVSDHDQARAQQLASAYAEELNRMMAQLSTSAASRERKFLEERIAVVKQELDKSSAALAKFSSANSAINIPEQARAMLGAAASLQGERIAAESQLKGLEQIYAPSNVRVRSLRARIDELDRQLAKLGGGSQASDGQSELYPAIRQLPQLGADYAKFYRQAKTDETVFETLTLQYELAKVQEAKETPTVRVLDPAEYPERKSGPRRTFWVIGITFCWLLVVLAFQSARDVYAGIDPRNPLKSIFNSIAKDIREAFRFRSRSGIRFSQTWSAFFRRLQQPVRARKERQGTEEREDR